MFIWFEKMCCFVSGGAPSPRPLMKVGAWICIPSPPPPPQQKKQEMSEAYSSSFGFLLFSYDCLSLVRGPCPYANLRKSLWRLNGLLGASRGGSHRIMRDWKKYWADNVNLCIRVISLLVSYKFHICFVFVGWGPSDGPQKSYYFHVRIIPYVFHLLLIRSSHIEAGGRNPGPRNHITFMFLVKWFSYDCVSLVRGPSRHRNVCKEYLCMAWDRLSYHVEQGTCSSKTNRSFVWFSDCI